MNDLQKVADFVKENIPNAEILNVSHTQGIFSKDEKCKAPKQEGILVLITNSL